MSSINKIKVGDTVYTIADGTEPLIAPVQNSLVASKTYAVGEQFIYNGNLYKATASIASGSTITINGNCALADSIADQVTELNIALGKIYVVDKTVQNVNQYFCEVAINPATTAVLSAYSITSGSTRCKFLVYPKNELSVYGLQDIGQLNVTAGQKIRCVCYDY